MSQALIPVGVQLVTYRVSTIQVETVWWTCAEVYRYCGAATPARKRTIRRHLEALRPNGAYQDKRGRWHAAEVVARTYFAQYHDDALKRTTHGQRTDMRTFRPRSIPRAV